MTLSIGPSWTAEIQRKSTYRWWFRNPKANHRLDGAKTRRKLGDALPTSTGDCRISEPTVSLACLDTKNSCANWLSQPNSHSNTSPAHSQIGPYFQRISGYCMVPVFFLREALVQKKTLRTRVHHSIINSKPSYFHWWIGEVFLCPPKIHNSSQITKVMVERNLPSGAPNGGRCQNGPGFFHWGTPHVSQAFCNIMLSSDCIAWDLCQWATSVRFLMARHRIGEDVSGGGLLGCPVGSQDQWLVNSYNQIINGVYWDYNSLTNHLLAYWDIQESAIGLFPSSSQMLESDILGAIKGSVEDGRYSWTKFMEGTNLYVK